VSKKTETAVVVPTIREGSWMDWEKAWWPLLEKHKAWLIRVQDGDDPCATVTRPGEKMPVMEFTCEGLKRSHLPPEDRHLILDHTPACRNLGFYAVAKYLHNVGFIHTYDDDLTPVGDPIADHNAVLNTQVPISWFSTATPYMRGFPYQVRNEARVMFSMGHWEEVPDLDAPSQLVLGEKVETQFYRGPIPKGAFFPVCGMNCAFVRDLLPATYWAPVAKYAGCERFDDIWMGLFLKNWCDKVGVAMVSGYAMTSHQRASNPFKNLRQEAVGIEVNEELWKYICGDEYSCNLPGHKEFFDDYAKKRWLWAELIRSLEEHRCTFGEAK